MLRQTESGQGGVLIVEDEFFVSDDIAQDFRDARARVVGMVASVDAALALIAKAGSLAGAVLDVNLRGEMAFPMADELVWRGVPFLFTTGYDAAAIPARFAHVTVCEKPIDVNRIVQLLLAQGAERTQAWVLPLERGIGDSPSDRPPLSGPG